MGRKPVYRVSVGYVRTYHCSLAIAIAIAVSPHSDFMSTANLSMLQDLPAECNLAYSCILFHFHFWYVPLRQSSLCRYRGRLMTRAIIA